MMSNDELVTLKWGQLKEFINTCVELGYLARRNGMPMEFAQVEAQIALERADN